MDYVDLPPWAQTILTIVGVLSVVLPIAGRIVGRWYPELGAQLMALGNDLLGLREVTRTGMYAPLAPASVPTSRDARGNLVPDHGAGPGKDGRP